MQNWSRSSLVSKLKDLAERRKLEDLTIGPVLTVSRVLFAAILIILFHMINRIMVINHQINEYPGRVSKGPF